MTFLLRRNLQVVLSAILLAGFLVRIAFVNYGLTGDITAFAEWGEKFWQIGSKDFYFYKDWYYTFPTYPPLSSLIYAGVNWLNQHSYVLAQLHNSLKIVPAPFIIYFGKAYPLSPLLYTHGYFLLLKLTTILADLGIGLIVYKVVFEVTREKKKSLLASLFYFLNPVSIFISGVWGQSESLVAFFGYLAIIFIYYKKYWLSLPLFFVSLYIKPTWAIYIPLFTYLLLLRRPKFREVVLGVFVSFVIFLISTLPFASGNIFSFTKDIVVKNMLPSAKGAAYISNSAFNFHTIFYRIDRDFASSKYLVLSAKTTGYLVYILLNALCMIYLRKVKKEKLGSIIATVFIVGLGSYLFLTNMLERYFYSAFPALVMLVFLNPRIIKYALFINIILFANLFWSFYRRGSDELDHPFTDNNFFLIRILSVLIVVLFVLVSRALLKEHSLIKGKVKNLL